MKAKELLKGLCPPVLWYTAKMLTPPIAVRGTKKVYALLKKPTYCCPHTFFQDKDAFDLLFNLYVLEQGVGIFLKQVCVNHRITYKGLWS